MEKCRERNWRRLDGNGDVDGDDDVDVEMDVDVDGIGDGDGGDDGDGDENGDGDGREKRDRIYDLVDIQPRNNILLPEKVWRGASHPDLVRYVRRPRPPASHRRGDNDVR